MPDLDEVFARLRHGAPGGAPLPATEVRRLGERRRRRTTALAGVGGLAAVLLALGIPVALLDDGDTASPAPPVATSAPDSVTWRQEVPAQFPLAQGMASAEYDDISGQDAPATEDFELCDRARWTFEHPVRAVHVVGRFLSGHEHSRSRTLALYADDVAAGQALEAFRSAAEACPVEQDPDGIGSRRDLWAVGAGDEALGYSWRGAEDSAGALRGNLFAARFVRVGNALLVDSAYGEGGSSDAAVDRVLSEFDFESTQVLTALAALAD